MTLKSDELGFLQGDPVEWNRAVKLWTETRDELRALRANTGAVAAQAKRARTNNGGANPGSIESMAFKSLIEESKKAKKAAPKPVKVATPKKKAAATPSAARAVSAAKPKAKPVTPAKRGANGRFVSAKAEEERAKKAKAAAKPKAEESKPKAAAQPAPKEQEKAKEKEKKPRQGKDQGKEEADDESEEGKANTPLATAINGLNDTVSSAVLKAPDIDPTIAMAKEVHGIVSPIGRGWSKLFGKSEEKERKVWYKRIWETLRGIKDEESAYHVAEARRAGENKHGDKAAGAKSGGLLSNLLKMIPGGGLLSTLLGGLASGGGGLLGGALKIGKGALRRIPLLGALIAGGSAAASIFGPDDPNKTPEENRKARFTGGGSGIGALIGGGLGSFFGPVGILIGSVIGDKVGELVGDWLSTVDWKKVGDQITGAWDDTMKLFSSAWKGITDTISPVVDTVKAIVSGIGNWLQNKGLIANSAIKSATGVDVKETVGRVAGAATAAAGAAADYGKERATKMLEPIGRAGNAIKDWFLGKTSKAFESGRGGAGTVSTGKGDAGGASYGTYQLSSKAGTLGEFLSSTKYGKEFAGLEPGSPEFNAKWKSIAKSDPTFGDAQHEFMKSTHYDPQMAKLKAAGFDLSGRGAGVQDAVWSTATQFGGNTSLIEKALKGKDASKMSDTQIIAAIQDYKVANNETLFKSSSDDVRASTLKRASAEKARLIALSGGDPSSVAMSPAGAAQSIPLAQMPVASQSASVIPAMPAVTSVGAASPVPEMPSTQTAARIATSQKPQIIQVASNNDTVGQDVSDRKIAHIATGGIGGGITGL